MISAIDFLSLSIFQKLSPAADMVAVSIGDPAQMPPDNLHAFSECLRLEVLDVEPEDLELHGLPEEVLCPPAAIVELLRFLREAHSAKVGCRLVVHCNAGSSRSAAVALIAHAVSGASFPRRADAHFANQYIVRLAGQALQAPITVPVKLSGDEPHPYLPPSLQI